MSACSSRRRTCGNHNVRLGKIFGFQLLGNRCKGRNIIVIVLDLIRHKLVVSLTDEIILVTVDQHIRRERRFMIVGGNVCRKTAICRFHISIAVVDVSGIAVGAAVSYGKFGTGKVIELSGGYVTVSFEQGEKRFLFTKAFESGFLKVQ